MSTRDDILEQLKTDLQDYVKSSRSPYKSDIAVVKRGVYFYSDIVERPAICFAASEDKRHEEMFSETGTDQVRILSVYLYGYIDSDGLGNHDDLHQLTHDIEYFFKYHFTYKNNTYIVDIGMSERGIEDSTSMFDMDLEIYYTQEI